MASSFNYATIYHPAFRPRRRRSTDACNDQNTEMLPRATCNGRQIVQETLISPRYNGLTCGLCKGFVRVMICNCPVRIDILTHRQTNLIIALLQFCCCGKKDDQDRTAFHPLSVRHLQSELPSRRDECPKYGI